MYYGLECERQSDIVLTERGQVVLCRLRGGGGGGCVIEFKVKDTE